MYMSVHEQVHVNAHTKKINAHTYKYTNIYTGKQTYINVYTTGLDTE